MFPIGLRYIDWLIRGRTIVTDAYNGYRLAEAAVFVAFAADCLDELESAGFGQQQIDLLAIVRALADDDPGRAGALGMAAIARHRRYMAVYSL
jgi:hypothetical protein